MTPFTAHTESLIMPPVMPCEPILISIDPSSRITGVALFQGNTLLEWHLVKTSTKDPIDRCLMMAQKVEEFIHDRLETIPHKTVRVVVEVGGGSTRFSRGLYTLGFAAGSIISRLDSFGFKITTAQVGRWTNLGEGKCKPKKIRAEQIAEMYPIKYDIEKDKGLDGADAIGLGTWFLNLFECQI